MPRAAPVSCRKHDLPDCPSPPSWQPACVRIMRSRYMLQRSQARRLAETKPILCPQEMSPEATQVRSALALLILISCAGCADFQKLVAQGPAPPPAVAPANPPAPANPAPVADIAPARFECSDGTISSSQDACLIAMARARLPPSGSAAPTTAPAR